MMIEHACELYVLYNIYLTGSIINIESKLELGTTDVYNLLVNNIRKKLSKTMHLIQNYLTYIFC
jgi:hypothetical protein